MMKLTRKLSTLIYLLAVFVFFPNTTEAANLGVFPETGVYTVGSVFSVKIAVNTQGQSILSGEGTLKFNPEELSIVSLDKSGSVFNLWAIEPNFSNAAGTVTFAGGKIGGFTGSSGNILNVTFKTKKTGTARLSFSEGQIMANNASATNVLSAMSGGSFTVQPSSISPKPEIVEYVASVNTPQAPKINSTSHKDGLWSDKKTAVLSWSLPEGIIAVRTNLDKNESTIPTKVYENPIREITLNDLEDGVHYFHIQFKNSDGWGKVSHYKLSVDTEKPTSLKIALGENADLSNSTQNLTVETHDKTSGIERFSIKIDEKEAFSVLEKDSAGKIELPALLPGLHNVVIEAFDYAGNSISETFSFTTKAFTKPVFTEYPREINEQVIPVIRGETKAGSKVDIILRKVGQEPNSYEVWAEDNGVFTFIPEGTLSSGVYELTARATDKLGAKSELSEVVKIAVQQPGYIKIGSMLLSALSVFIPLVAVVLLLVLLCWYLLVYLRKFKKRLTKESSEVVDILGREFDSLEKSIENYKIKLQNSRRTKSLTLVEAEIIENLTADIKISRKRIEKEITDVEKVIKEK